MNFGELMSLYLHNEMKYLHNINVYIIGMQPKIQFIESLLLEIPIPPIFVIEDENGVWDVIDGVQRLLIFFFI